MIRLGSIKAGTDRLSAVVRGLRDDLAGHLRGVATLHDRSGVGETSNSAVLGRLATKHPDLFKGLDPVARAAISREWKGARSKLINLTYHATLAVAHELAARLRSGRYVTNTPATTRRKADLGQSTTPGVATGQLAVALDNATVTVE